MDYLDAATARHIILHLQGLSLPHHKRLDDDGLLALIEQLGFVQMDSIQWVERAHHMILQSRSQAYRPAQLKRLHEKKRHLFEHWTHDASFIPTTFHPWWQHRYAREHDRMASRFERWQGPGYRDKCAALLARIERDGPLMSRHLERDSSKPKEMWQWHDGKAALEFLWHTGALAITRRDGFQKVYDLTHRVIEGSDLTCPYSEDQFVDWACRAALERLGFGTPAQIARYFDLVSVAEARDWVAQQGDNTLRPITVAGGTRKKPVVKDCVARADLASVIENLPALPARMRVLSPFDPVIRDRDRLEWLWGFDYRIEIYVPAEKRRWGYYIFPLLEGQSLVGRVDMKANRKEGLLDVKRVWWETDRPPSAARLGRLDAEMQRQARFCGLDGVRYLDGAVEGLAGRQP